MSRSPEPDRAARDGSLLDWFSSRLNLTEMFSLLTSYGLYHAELDTRKPLREALAEVESQEFGSFGRWPRVLSLFAVVLLAIELLTGALLALYYLPTPDTARASLGTILRDVDFGWLIHQVHYWGAQVLIGVLVLRLAILFTRRVYKAPRELFWVFGAVLLLVCFHLDLTGRALPMTDDAYWSIIRALEIADSVPVYGSMLMLMLGGAGTVIGELTLIRFYILHVAVLPLMAMLMVYLHFSGVRRVGMTEIAGEQMRRGRTVLRRHFFNLAIALAALFGIIGTLAVLVPHPFGIPADVYATPTGIGPPWYLLAPFGFLEWASGPLPRFLSGGILFLLFVVFVAWPFIDRGDSARRRTFNWIIGAAVLTAWIILSLYGARVA
jgi:quinol-cytochrome oxidoreductase complex cytochrome b subunit